MAFRAPLLWLCCAGAQLLAQAQDTERNPLKHCVGTAGDGSALNQTMPYIQIAGTLNCGSLCIPTIPKRQKYDPEAVAFFLVYKAWTDFINNATADGLGLDPPGIVINGVRHLVNITVCDVQTRHSLTPHGAHASLVHALLVAAGSQGRCGASLSQDVGGFDPYNDLAQKAYTAFVCNGSYYRGKRRPLPHGSGLPEGGVDFLLGPYGSGLTLK